MFLHVDSDAQADLSLCLADRSFHCFYHAGLIFLHCLHETQEHQCIGIWQNQFVCCNSVATNITCDFTHFGW